MSGLYDKIKEDEKFRREWAEKCGFGFELPSVVPNVPKIEKMTRLKRPRKSLIVGEKEWSALVDDFRTLLRYP